MSVQLLQTIGWIGFALSAASVAYSLLATVAVILWRQRRVRPDQPDYRPPVTVLKPLCGDEPCLYDALRSFCVQRYPQYQIVFGVREGADRARRVVERLQREFKTLDMTLVVNDRVIGRNFKVSNLANMVSAVRYDHLVIADSDVIVGPDYLANVVQPLASRSVGLVTCIYRGRAMGHLASRIGALFIDGWFMPAVLVSRLLGSQSFVSGATMALRRDTLEAIGGFEKLANHLADDYILGRLVRQRGLRTVIAPVTVETVVTESDLSSVVGHELRWMRTIRSLQPAGYVFSGITCGMAVPIFGVVMGAGTLPVLGLLTGSLLLRLVLHCAWAELPPIRAMRAAWLVPARDLLVFGVWSAGFFCRNVSWRQQTLSVAADGSLH